MKKGFTLIETLIAMILLAGALIVLGSSWSGSLTAIRKSRSLTTLSLLLQKKITEYEIKYSEKKGSNIPEEEEGDFGDDFPNYRWKMQSKAIGVPDLSKALTARDGGATETEIMVVKQLKDMIESAVKELKVSVFWKVETKELEYSITTYLVNYDNADFAHATGADIYDPNAPPESKENKSAEGDGK